jgi:acylpyruvate hydrolase
VRLTTVRHEGGTRAGRVDGDVVHLLDATDVGTLLGDPGWRRAPATGETVRMPDADLAPLIPFPRKFIGVGLNYRRHIEEAGLEVPSHPMLFAKFARALIGAHDPITIPAVASQLDWEAELGVVIGSGGRHLDPAGAAAAIAGYTVINDVSARDWQRRTSEVLQGKTFEGTTPVGPVMITPDEVADATGLRIWCEVDGECMQDASTAELVFDPHALVSYISAVITLEPGDVIATGTPGGVGGGRKPPVFLRPGNVVRTCVEGIGELRNRCVAEPR